MLIKFIITVFILINLSLPLVSLVDISLICFLILLSISTSSTLSLKQVISQKHKLIFILVLLTIANFASPKLKIEEAHSVFVNNNDLKVIEDFLPPKIITDIKHKFKNFDVDRMIKGHDILNSTEDYNKIKTINIPYAYSSDSFFQKNKFSRQVNKINFSSREELRIGHLNTLKYALVYDKKFRRILPFYVLYEIPKIAKDSKICIDGNVYYYFSHENFEANEIQNIPFKRVQNKKCLELENNFEKLYIVGFSINDKDNISIQLQKNTFLKLLEIIKYIIIIIFSLFFLFQLKPYINSIIYFISVAATFIWALIKDSNTIFGLRYFRGGADGVLYNSYAQDIVQNINEGNFLLALRGGSDVFYFMPGQRYFNAFSKLFFGDSNYAYLLISTLLPFGLFVFFKKYLNEKYAIILFISFVFIPVFENMGFGYFNYIWQAVRNHAETQSIILIMFSLIFILDISDNSKTIDNTSNTNLKTIIVGLCLSFAAISRPNFFPTTLFLCSYVTIIFALKKHYLKSVLIFFSFSTVILCLVHNIYFGQSFYLFTYSHVHNFPLNFNDYIDAIKNLILFDFQNQNLKIIFNQLSLWNPAYNIHRLLIIAIILYFIITRKQTMFTYLLLISAISQHVVLLISFPSSRYAYLAWLLTFVLFLKIEFDNQLVKTLFFWFKRKSSILRNLR